MKVLVILPFHDKPFRLVQFILESQAEIERFAEFYLKDSPSIAALVDVLLGKKPGPQVKTLTLTDGMEYSEEKKSESATGQS